jgi:hypothetical protein
MKNFILLALISFCFFGTAETQNVSTDWLKLYKGTGSWIARDIKNNIYAASGDGIILLHKRDKFGNFLWERKFTTDSIFNFEKPARVHVDSSGNVIVVGYRYTFSQENGARANALIVLKYSPAGALLWQKIIRGYFSAIYQERYHNSVTSQEDANNNTYIASGGNVAGGISGFNTIKINSAGDIVWIRVQSFANSAFYQVNNIQLKEPLLALAGFNALTGPAALIWVLDTAGTNHWNDAKKGLRGQDITYDNNNNIYLLTSIVNGAGVNTATDVSVYKFTAGGSQLWVHSYDFGGYEGVRRIQSSAVDNTIVIMANGNHYFTGGSLYIDWLTIKIDALGNMIWNKRYDKQSNNDEYSVEMVLNKRGDIYLTGIGGPFPGGSNLGKRQWVTAKYLANGKLDWFVPIDTVSEYITGVSLVPGNDGTLFVLADVQTAIIHLFDFRGHR